jgi:hypothetical protein
MPRLYHRYRPLAYSVPGKWRCLNRVLLITDGLANVCVTDPEVIVSQAKGLYERGIATGTIGVGNKFNEDLLVAMAKGAGGNGWFVEGPEDFQRIFETEMEGLLRETCSKDGMKLSQRKGSSSSICGTISREALTAPSDFRASLQGNRSISWSG